MAAYIRTKADMLTEIMLAIFRVNGRLLEKGDELVAPLHITSSRWQLLGALALGGGLLTAPQIGEAMGLTRQAVQKQLNKMIDEGFVEQSPNPRHERSPLYSLTPLGKRTFRRAMKLEGLWAERIVTGLSKEALQCTLRTLDDVFLKLDAPVPSSKDLARKAVRSG
jgi:DNA-binding MarR family transcriptional regulator